MKAEIVVTFEGTIQSTGLTLHARTSYLPHEIEWGKMFVETTHRDSLGSALVDWELFDETMPCATFNDTNVFDGDRLGVSSARKFALGTPGWAATLSPPSPTSPTAESRPLISSIVGERHVSEHHMHAVFHPRNGYPK